MKVSQLPKGEVCGLEYITIVMNVLSVTKYDGLYYTAIPMHVVP